MRLFLESRAPREGASLLVGVAVALRAPVLSSLLARLRRSRTAEPTCAATPRQFRDPGRSLSWVCRSHARDERPRHETQVGMVDAFAACLNLLDGHLSDTSLLCPPNRVKLTGDLFPPAVPAKHDGFPLATACPNPAGLERPTRVDVAELLRAVSEHIIAVAKGDEEQARKTTDQAFWPMLGSLRTGQGGNPGDVQPLDQSRVARFGPASESPHAEFIKNNCGEETLKASWWIQTLPAGNGNVSASQSLKGNFYLINRKGHWLIWGSE